MFWINSYYGYAVANYFFISGNFYFSIVIFIIVQYITTPKNNEKIKINWDKKLTTTDILG